MNFENARASPTNIPGTDTPIYEDMCAGDGGQDTSVKKRRSSLRAGKVDAVPIPAKVTLITHEDYFHALSFCADRSAWMHLLPQDMAETMGYADGQLSIDGLPVNLGKLKKYCAEQNLSEIDLALLHGIHSVFSYKVLSLAKDNPKILTQDCPIDSEITLFFPELLEYMGTQRTNIHADMIQNIIKKIQRFHGLVGVIAGQPGISRSTLYPVVQSHEYDADRNTIRIVSPYLAKIEQVVIASRIESEGKGKKPVHSKELDARILSERNTRAIEIACELVTIIERAGRAKPNIKASTLLERNPELKQAVTNAKTNSDRNKLLDRAFSKAWELLQKYTTFGDRFDLPTFVPTMSTLDTTIMIPRKTQAVNKP